MQMIEKSDDMFTGFEYKNWTAAIQTRSSLWQYIVLDGIVLEHEQRVIQSTDIVGYVRVTLEHKRIAYWALELWEDRSYHKGCGGVVGLDACIELYLEFLTEQGYLEKVGYREYYITNKMF